MIRTSLIFLCIAILSSSSFGFAEFRQTRHSVGHQESLVSPRAASPSIEDKEVAKRIMYNQQSRRRESIHYQIIAAEATESLVFKIGRFTDDAAYLDQFHGWPAEARRVGVVHVEEHSDRSH